MAAAAEDWTAQDNRRMLHVVYRVGDMDATMAYYEKHFGMKQLRYRDVPEEKYTNAFLGYGPETTNFAVELTKNYGVDSYDIGPGFGHFGIVTDDVYKMCDSIKTAGGKVRCRHQCRGCTISGDSCRLEHSFCQHGFVHDFAALRVTRQPPVDT